MRNKRKRNATRKLGTAAMVIILGMSLTACSKEQETVETDVFSMSSIDNETPETGTTEIGTTEIETTEIEGTETVEGMIESVGNSSFTILKTQKKDVGNGLVEVGGTDEVCKIVFSKYTRFLLCKVKDDGINPSESSQSDTTKDSLVKNTIAKATGSNTEDGLVATEVIVYQFE